MSNITITLIVWFWLLPAAIIGGAFGTNYLYAKFMGFENFAKIYNGEETLNLNFSASEPWYHLWLDYMTYQYITQCFIHLSPYVIVLLNIYFTDVKPLKMDYKFVYFIAGFYTFWNFLGNWDMSYYGGLRVYPIIDWKNYFYTFLGFVALYSFMGTLYYYDCIWRDGCWKRRSDQRRQ